MTRTDLVRDRQTIGRQRDADNGDRPRAARRPRSASAFGRLIVAAVLLLATGAGAHERPASYSTWRLIATAAPASEAAVPAPATRRYAVTWRMNAREATRLPWYRPSDPEAHARLADYLSARLTLRAGRAPCLPERPGERGAAPEGVLVYRWSVACASPSDATAGAVRTLRSDLFREVAPAHLHFARFESPGRMPIEAVLTLASPEVIVEAADTSLADTTSAGIFDSAWLGIDHISTGYDHLLFLLALILMERSLLTVARVVTGFTIAHSLTLALAALGWLQPDLAAVEPLIALSIAALAAENLWVAGGRSPFVLRLLGVGVAATAVAAALGFGRISAVTLSGLALFTVCYLSLVGRAADPRRLRWAAAFVFGLLHGFGFAGFLLEASFSRAAVATRLFGFNVGVEVGQLLAVALAWPLLMVAARRLGPRFDRVVVEPCSVAVLVAGVYWFTVRTYF